MAQKIDISSSSGAKIIGLFARLLFAGEPLSLIELAQRLQCSKQTVIRLIEEIERSYSDIKKIRRGKRMYYQLGRVSKAIEPLPITGREMSLLLMCKAFAEGLLGMELFNEVSQALEKGMLLVPKEELPASSGFGSFRPGSIDYGPHRETLLALLKAMERKKILRLSYKSPGKEIASGFLFKPYKIFSRNETLYVHGGLAQEQGEPYRKPDYDPLLAVHRIEKAEITEWFFQIPPEYDFEKVFNRHFGLIKGRAFKVVAELTGYSAVYVAERIWSPDQRIVKSGDDAVKLTFTATSEPEVISWMLSFGKEARLIKPKRLVKKLKAELEGMWGGYL
ncbi:MAG: WYL domain-containing protein [Desulfobacteraceae bacterium]|nr:MAG: WYL domain-containing protein [Desulfobacteraceae bacterium]